MTTLANRYDIVFLFDVTNGNPNGDPDAGNMPRIDPETNHGLVSDVSLKRKVRDFVHAFGGEGEAVFILSKEPLNPKIAKACEVNDLPTFRKAGGGWETKLAKNRNQKDIRLLQEWLCAQYYDIRTFGAVLSTGPNAGQIRGPVQFNFGTSIEKIMPHEHTITRITDVDKEEGEMGRKYTVPYGLYRTHVFVSAKLAEQTGFNEADLRRLFQALSSMFDHDRSAARGEMASRKVIAFKHASALGNESAHRLFERVKVRRNIGGELYEIGDPRIDNYPPARRFADYAVEIDRGNLPEGVEIVEIL